MRAAFSLVELSVVIVILGLLVGGILAGQSLIRAAELRSVTTDLGQYQAAVVNFREQYDQLPGDINNATDFWGAMTNCGAANPSGSGTETCNGDRNGEIDIPSAAGRAGEVFTFWQHLANAGLIEGSYTGIAGPDGTRDSYVNVNVPESKMSTAGWAVDHHDNSGGSRSAPFALDFGNHFNFGTRTSWGGGTGGMRGQILFPEEAWSIDKKIDDGLPAQGEVTIDDAYNTCTTAATNTSADFDATYLLTRDDIGCSLLFIKQF